MVKVLVDAYFFKNLGDDLLVKVLTESFQNINFYAQIPSNFEYFYKGWPNLNVSQKNILAKTVDKLNLSFFNRLYYQRFSGIIDIGGSIFMQTSSSNQVIRPRINKLRSNVPYVVVGSNFGPFHDQSFVEEYKNFFRKLYGVSFRDSYSYQLFKNDGNVILAPDMVFNLDIQKVQPYQSDVPYIVISNINLSKRKQLKRHNNDYEDKLAKLSSFYLQKGYKIKILPFSAYEGDSESAERIKLKIGDPFKNVEIIEYTDINLYLSLIKGAKKMISTRFHAMVLGWLFAVPQLVISYSKKTTNEIDDLFPKQSFLTIDDFVNYSGEIGELIFNTMPKSVLQDVRKKSEAHLNLLDKFFVSLESKK